MACESQFRRVEGHGRASELALLNAGHSVMLAGCRADALQETAALAGALSKNALPMATDVTDAAAVKLFAATHKTFGRLGLELGLRAAAVRAPYTATQHAMTGVTEAVSLDGRARDIACGQIDIGNAAAIKMPFVGRG